MENIKLTKLLNILRDMESALLAYSGGVDSTLLLKAMQLSGIRGLAVTGVSEIIPYDDVLTADRAAEGVGLEHRAVKTGQLFINDFIDNTPQRCFFCKDELFRKLAAIASDEGYGFLIDGSNIDDASDYRPGRKAAIKYDVRSPLTEAGFSKVEIRDVSQQLGISTWDRPSSSCLATRIPYGQRITREALKRVERAENFLRSLGFHEIRVRDHSDVARIEVRAEEIALMLSSEKREAISGTLRSFGFKFVSVDLEGYVSGGMNRILKGY